MGHVSLLSTVVTMMNTNKLIPTTNCFATRIKLKMSLHDAPGKDAMLL